MILFDKYKLASMLFFKKWRKNALHIYECQNVPDINPTDEQYHV